MTAATITKLATYVCGHCSSGHCENCRVEYPGPIKCTCKQPHKPVRCRDCNAERTESNPLDPATIVCTNRTDCLATVAARLDADPLVQMLRECQTTTLVAGEVVERPRRASKLTGSAKRAVAEPKAVTARPCTCGCEGTTKGGAFLPGHDARMVAALAKQIKDDRNLASQLVAMLADFPALQAKLLKRIEA